MRRRGFSPTEIATVFGIIAMLAAILFATSLRAGDDGRQMRCAGPLRNVGTALAMYAADHGQAAATPTAWSSRSELRVVASEASDIQDGEAR